MMRKIIEQAVVTLDGQISTPQDWLPIRWPGEFEELSRGLLFSVDALLYGRVSYESHAEVWPTLEEAFGDYAVRMNTIPKHVASRTLTDVHWNATCSGTTSSRPCAISSSNRVARCSRSGPGARSAGPLLEHRLVDEYLFWLFPVIAGSGARLYDGIDSTDFDLVDVQRLDNGILGLTYVPAVR